MLHAAISPNPNPQTTCADFTSSQRAEPFLSQTVRASSVCERRAERTDETGCEGVQSVQLCGGYIPEKVMKGHQDIKDC